jgi:NADPH-dependent 2,4-dienoyl-CoA reductase/sulfur reductase-like enzyme/pSer/pThr/pTyr-binding forkhead associated (FHA) protein
MAGRRYTILGDGAAGMTAVETLRRLDPVASITVVSDDPHPTYFRAALTNYLLGELRDDQIWAAPPSFYEDSNADRVLARAVSVDTRAARVHLANGANVPYEALLVATGARARPATFDGADLAGVVALRTLGDARAILELVARGDAKRAVVVGGGPLGLELAHALRERGLAVTLLVRSGRLMPETLDATAADLLFARMRRGGIDVLTGDEIARAIPSRDRRVGEVLTCTGVTIAADLVAVAIGVVCNTEVLGGSGVELGPRGGVAVDDGMRSSVSGIWAAGDVAEHRGRLLQLWEPARRTAEIAAATMSGKEATYAPGAHYFATRLYDLDFAAIGSLEVAEGDTDLVDLPRSTGRIAYKRLVVREGKLRGVLLLGEREEGVRRRGRLYQRLVDSGLDVTTVVQSLLDPGFDLRGWMDTRTIVARPEASPPGRRPAEVRGTQRFAAATVAAGPLTSAIAPARGKPRSAKLSIGLRLAPEAPPRLDEGAALAHLEGLGKRFPLELSVVAIGRAGTIAIDDPLVSARHAEIAHHAGARWLRDAGSRNGTWVNGELVTVPRALHDGDAIRLGSTELVFRSGEASPRARPPRTLPDAASILVLEVRAGPGVGLRFALQRTYVAIGRDPTNEVRLDELSVSRRHAELVQRDGRWFVTDLQSSLGTKKNGNPLAPGKESLLEEGDLLAIGQVTLAFTRSRTA